jgi:RNA polymerase sigma-70 factor (ECF subfamily)
VPKLTDEQLVIASISDPEQFAELIDRYQLKLFHYIKRLINISDADAEDLLQEVFLKIYQALNGFDSKLKFSSWAYRITHNHTISHYRKLKARLQTLTEQDSQVFFEKLTAETDLEKEADQKFLQEKVAKALSKLDNKYKEVLILKFLEDKDYQEISDILKKPMGTIATLINRAKAKFKSQYHV